MDTSFHVEERVVFDGLPPFPWERSPVGWTTLSAACQAMEESRRSPGDRFRVDYRVVKIMTVVVCRDDENINCDHASGQCVCEACGKLYVDHGMAEEILGYMDQPWLHRLCDGRLVKL